MVKIDPAIIAAAQAAEKKWRVPASVSLAQYGLESAWGAKAPGNNPFGIKHLAGYPDQHFLTHEVVNGKRITEEQTFASFKDMNEAFDVHAKLLATSHYYIDAMAALPDLTKFVKLMAVHYATAPNYADMVLQIIHGSNLQQYDAGHTS